MSHERPRKRDLLDPLRDADRTLQRQSLSESARGRLERLVSQGLPARPAAHRRAVAIVGGLVAAFALAALIGVFVASKRSPDGGITWSSGALAHRDDEGWTCESARCEAKDRAQNARITMQKDASLRRDGARLRVVSGRVTFRVEHRRAGRSPFVVLVSHGQIEVYGTHFDVFQTRETGKVSLYEGSIGFRSSDGQLRKLRPGQSLQWPVARASAKRLPSRLPKTPVTKRPAPKCAAAKRPRRKPAALPLARAKTAPAPLSKRELGVLHRQVAAAIDRARYRMASGLIAKALPRIARRATRERWSFQLGDILSNHLTDREAACRHWRDHVATFGRKRYGQEIEQAKKKLGCK
jgi:hypothetical protein